MQAGQDRDGLLVRAGGGGWGVEIEGENRIAQIENPSSLPESSKEGQGVKVYVREASKKKYWVRVDGFL